MSLGDERVRSLSVYLAGYVQARIDLGAMSVDGHTPTLRTFYRFLAAKFQVRDNIGWEGVIEQQDGSDRNVRTFFRLFDEFLEVRATRGDAWIEAEYRKLGLLW